MIATWNVNSIRSRLEHLLAWLQQDKPDIALLQELKCTAENFPYEQIEALGYNVAVHGQKSYNGVAILSKFPVEDIVTTLPGDGDDTQARYIEAVVTLSAQQVIRVASVYVPNGNSIGSDKFHYKQDFLQRLYRHMHMLLSYEEMLVIGGDYNVAPERQDVYDPIARDGSICFHPDERHAFRALLYLGMTNAFRALHPEARQFSWWDYRAGAWAKNEGMLIDHLLLSPQAADRLRLCRVNENVRSWDKASDHAPVECCLGNEKNMPVLDKQSLSKTEVRYY